MMEVGSSAQNHAAVVSMTWGDGGMKGLLSVNR